MDYYSGRFDVGREDEDHEDTSSGRLVPYEPPSPPPRSPPPSPKRRRTEHVTPVILPSSDSDVPKRKRPLYRDEDFKSKATMETRELWDNWYLELLNRTPGLFAKATDCPLVTDLTRAPCGKETDLSTPIRYLTVMNSMVRPEQPHPDNPKQKFRPPFDGRYRSLTSGYQTVSKLVRRLAMSTWNHEVHLPNLQYIIIDHLCADIQPKLQLIPEYVRTFQINPDRVELDHYRTLLLDFNKETSIRPEDKPFREELNRARDYLVAQPQYVKHKTEQVNFEEAFRAIVFHEELRIMRLAHQFCKVADRVITAVGYDSFQLARETPFNHRPWMSDLKAPTPLSDAFLDSLAEHLQYTTGIKFLDVEEIDLCPTIEDFHTLLWQPRILRKFNGLTDAASEIFLWQQQLPRNQRTIVVTDVGVMFYIEKYNTWVFDPEVIKDHLLEILAPIRQLLGKSIEPNYVDNLLDAMRATLDKEVYPGHDSYLDYSQLTTSGKLAFTNGYVDFETYTFKPRDRSIPFTMSTMSEFVPRSEISAADLAEVDRLGAPFKDPAVWEVVLQHIAMCVSGPTTVKKDALLNYFGGTNSGKSLLIDLIRKTFGTYIGDFTPERLLRPIGTGDDAAKENGWVGSVCYKRLLVASEPATTGKLRHRGDSELGRLVLNPETVKVFFGGTDRICTRLLYKHVHYMKCKFGLILVSNDPVELESGKVSDAILTRILYVENQKTAVTRHEKPDIDPHEEFHIDPELLTKASTVKFQQAFLYRVHEAYARFCKNGHQIIRPESVNTVNREIFVLDDFETVLNRDFEIWTDVQREEVCKGVTSDRDRASAAFTWGWCYGRPKLHEKFRSCGVTLGLSVIAQRLAQHGVFAYRIQASGYDYFGIRPRRR